MFLHHKLRPFFLFYNLYLQCVNLQWSNDWLQCQLNRINYLWYRHYLHYLIILLLLFITANICIGLDFGVNSSPCNQRYVFSPMNEPHYDMFKLSPIVRSSFFNIWIMPHYSYRLNGIQWVWWIFFFFLCTVGIVTDEMKCMSSLHAIAKSKSTVQMWQVASIHVVCHKQASKLCHNAYLFCGACESITFRLV